MTLWKQVKGLNEKGHDITVITSKTSETETSEVIDGIKIIRPFSSGSEVEKGFLQNLYQQSKRLRFSLKLYPFLKDFLEKGDFDVIINLAYIPTISSTWTAHKESIPSITNVRSYGGKVWFKMTHPITALINFTLEVLTLKLGKHDVVLCPSLDTKKKLKGISTADMEILHNPFAVNKIRNIGKDTDEKKIRKILGISTEEKFLLFVGSLYPVKNVAEMVSELSRLDSKFKLIIIGDGPERENIQKSASEKGIEENLVFLGKKEHEETLKVISACDFLLLPSLTETFSNVIIEALILNRPVISTEVGITEEVKSPNLHLVEKVEDIPDVLTEDIESKKDKNTYDRFSFEYIISKLEQLLYEVKKDER